MKINRSPVINLELELTMGRHWPEVQFNCDTNIISTVNVSQHRQLTTICCLPTDTLKLEYNKTPDETIVDENGTIVRDQTVSIKNFWVNDILVPNTFLLLHSKYYPKYHSGFLDYCEKNNITVNNGPLHETKFWHSGVWEFKFRLPFWDWFFEQEHLAKQTEHNPDLVGYSKEHVLQQLQKIKDCLL